MNPRKVVRALMAEVIVESALVQRMMGLPIVREQPLRECFRLRSRPGEVQDSLGDRRGKSGRDHTGVVDVGLGGDCWWVWFCLTGSGGSVQ